MLVITWCRIFCLPISHPIIIYRIIIFPLALYGCETRSLTLREERGLRMFEKRVLKRIFGLKDKITREQNKPHNEEFNDLHSSPTTIWVIKMRRMRWAGHVACMRERFLQGVGRETGGEENTCKTPRREDNIKMDL